MLLKSLLEEVNYTDVEVSLLALSLNDTKNIKDGKYKAIFYTLKQLHTILTDIDIILSEDINDLQLCSNFKYHVTGKTSANELLFIQGVPWSEWLGMNISSSLESKFSSSEIVAICLYNLSYFGYSEEEIQYHTHEHYYKKDSEHSHQYLTIDDIANEYLK